MSRPDNRIKPVTYLVEQIAEALEHRRVRKCFTDNRVGVPPEIAERCDGAMLGLAEALEWYVQARIEDHERSKA